MTRRTPFAWVAAIAATTVFGISCSREAEQDQAARTTTGEGTSTAPASSTAERRDHALVRVVHAIPGGDPVDIYAGENKAFTSVRYKTVTPYRELPDDRIHFKVVKSGQAAGAPLAENSEGLSGGNHYTLVVFPGERGEAATLRVMADDLTPPEAGKAKVRVINATPDVGEVELAAPGKKDALLDSVGPAAPASYDTIDPVPAPLIVRQEDNKAVLTRITDGQIESGKLYTIMLVGRKVGNPKLEAVMIQDELTGPMVGRPGATAESSTR